MDPKVVTSVLGEIDDWYGAIAPLTVTRGKVHDYLGMTIDYSEEGKVKFTICDYCISMTYWKNYHPICGDQHQAQQQHIYSKPTLKIQK